jgi:hypothetical protein
MDELTRYYVAERMTALQREYALLKTALDQDSELTQIRGMLSQPQAIHAVPAPDALEGEVIRA